MKRIGWYWSSNNIINNILGSIYGFIRLEWMWQPKTYFTRRVFGWKWRVPIYKKDKEDYDE